MERCRYRFHDRAAAKGATADTSAMVNAAMPRQLWSPGLTMIANHTLAHAHTRQNPGSFGASGGTAPFSRYGAVTLQRIAAMASSKECGVRSAAA